MSLRAKLHSLFRLRTWRVKHTHKAQEYRLVFLPYRKRNNPQSLGSQLFAPFQQKLRVLSFKLLYAVRKTYISALLQYYITCTLDEAVFFFTKLCGNRHLPCFAFKRNFRKPYRRKFSDSNSALCSRNKHRNFRRVAKSLVFAFFSATCRYACIVADDRADEKLPYRRNIGAYR